jgi:hypothetical protein
MATRLTSHPVVRCVLACALPLLIFILPTLAAPDNIITVCPVGCDYNAIQPAIDAANFGDTVVVSAGTYTAQLTLKSGLTLTSADGPTSTIVTAVTGPIVLAEAVTATQFAGFTVDGSAIITPAIGLSIVDSEFTLANSRIQHVHGLTGTGTITGGDAIGLRITGTFSVTVEHTTIADIQGGNASPDPYANASGGSATGIAAIGNGQLAIRVAQIQALTGGDPTYYEPGGSPWDCSKAGGDSIGISKQGNAALSLNQVSVTQLAGGQPCRRGIGGCDHHGGQAIGVHAISGTLDVRHTTIANLTSEATWSSLASYGIRSQATDETRIEHTHIMSLTAGAVLPSSAAFDHRPQTPSCGLPPGTGIGISLEDGHHASVEYTVVDGVAGTGPKGAGLGVQSDHITHVTLSHNQLLNLSGGYNGWWYYYDNAPIYAPQAAGMTVLTAQQADIVDNLIGQVRGSDGFDGGLLRGFAYPAGNAAGIHVISTTSASLINNLVFAVAGGNGVDNQSQGPPQQLSDGGHAMGLFIEDTTSRLQNNTLYDLRGGAAGQPTGAPGQGIGIHFAQAPAVLALNNAIISSTIGVSATIGTYLWDYTALWHTTLDYRGIISGFHDLHNDPRFVDAAHGDFRPSFNSPLIDSGFNALVPDDDLVGNLRPIDGNGDGLAIVDIGAYEYQPVPLNTAFLPIVFAQR